MKGVARILLCGFSSEACMIKNRFIGEESRKRFFCCAPLSISCNVANGVNEILGSFGFAHISNLSITKTKAIHSHRSQPPVEKGVLKATEHGCLMDQTRVRIHPIGVRCRSIRAAVHVANITTPQHNQFDLLAVVSLECFRLSFRSKSGQNSFKILDAMSTPSCILSLETASVAVRLSA
jgi:hypothetical protein